MLPINKIYNSDCLKEMKLIDDHFVDLIFNIIFKRYNSLNMWQVLLENFPDQAVLKMYKSLM